MISKVDAIIENASVRFIKWVEIYKPWHGENHTTERNLSFQFATAFLDLYQGGLAFMEVPFSNTEGGPNNNHLDAYLHADNFGLLIECKNIYAPSHIKTVIADINRMDDKLVSQLHGRHENRPVITHTHAVVFGETWYQHVADWWTSNYKGNRVAWKSENLKLPDGWIYKVKKVDVPQNPDKPNEMLFWLYGVSEQSIRGEDV